MRLALTTLAAFALAGCTLSVTAVPAASPSTSSSPAATPLASDNPAASATPAPSASPTASPAPVASSSPTASGGLTGSWTFGSANEPPAGSVTVPCLDYQATTLTLTQSGSQLTGNVMACLASCRLTEQLTGSFVGTHVELTGMADGAPVTYVLELSPTTGHLVGTRNGSPYWAARAVSPVAKGNCPV